MNYIYFLSFLGVTGGGVESPGFDQSKRLRTVGDYSQSYVATAPYGGPPPNSWVPQR